WSRPSSSASSFSGGATRRWRRPRPTGKRRAPPPDGPRRAHREGARRVRWNSAGALAGPAGVRPRRAFPYAGRLPIPRNPLSGPVHGVSIRGSGQCPQGQPPPRRRGHTMSGSVNAWPWMADPDTVRRDVENAHEHFADSGRIDVRVRPLVGESWLRSARHGAHPGTTGPRVALDTHDLREHRRTHPLAVVMPLVRHLLVEVAPEPQIVAVGDADGRLLWVEGDHRLRTRAEDMHFVEGASWNEGSIGTNAPGL